MFKISSFGTNRRLNTFAPLVNCVTDDALSYIVSAMAPAGPRGQPPVGNPPPNQDPGNDGDDGTVPIIRVNDSAIIIVPKCLRLNY